MLTLGIVPDPKGREAHFQDFAYVLVLKGVGPSEELLVQKEKKSPISRLVPEPGYGSLSRVACSP